MEELASLFFGPVSVHVKGTSVVRNEAVGFGYSGKNWNLEQGFELNSNEAIVLMNQKHPQFVKILW